MTRHRQLSAQQPSAMPRRALRVATQRSAATTVRGWGSARMGPLGAVRPAPLCGMLRAGGGGGATVMRLRAPAQPARTM